MGFLKFSLGEKEPIAPEQKKKSSFQYSRKIDGRRGERNEKKKTEPEVKPQPSKVGGKKDELRIFRSSFLSEEEGRVGRKGGVLQGLPSLSQKKNY